MSCICHIQLAITISDSSMFFKFLKNEIGQVSHYKTTVKFNHPVCPF